MRIEEKKRLKEIEELKAQIEGSKTKAYDRQKELDEANDKYQKYLAQYNEHMEHQLSRTSLMLIAISGVLAFGMLAIALGKFL